MLAPSGDQYEIRHAGYRAVVTESGGALRVLEHEGRPVLDGFGTDEMASGGRGQLLMPWPNRLEDGSYTFGGRDHQLALTEPAEGGEVRFGDIRLRVLHTPGHTEGSVCLFAADEGLLYSGDTLFAGSIGRTDFAGEGVAETSVHALYDPAQDRWLRLQYRLGGGGMTESVAGL